MVMLAMEQHSNPHAPAPYHHGDLRRSLLTAAEAILAEKGVGGFTLRECARRAGVSPAAPSHHFGNVKGLLSVIATDGYDALSLAMTNAADASDGSPTARLRAIGRAYIAQALHSPGRFRVTFGQSNLDDHDANLQRAAAACFQILVDTVTAATQRDPMESTMMVWSVVHGFVSLILDRHTPFLNDCTPPRETIDQMVEALLDQCLRAL